MKVLVIFLTVTLVAPSVFLVAPQKIHAALPVFETNPVIVGSEVTTAAQTTITSIKEALNLISTWTNTAANYAMMINAYVLQPLAFVLSGDLMKRLTAGVINFIVNGAVNGTGVPQFVQNLQGHMQMVGDTRALAFFVQFGRNSNSPFASAITSALRINYLQNTSSAGFFAANRSTLARYSPNVNAFLNGNWSQGGAAAWFALTTQSQNNPYMLYQASQAQLASVVGGAQAARLAELNWAQGFLSWCGPAEMATTDEGDGTAMEGTAPGDACTLSDGTLGTVKTPGSTIKATLDKVLGGSQDKLAQMGSVAKEITGIMGNIGTVFQTINLASQILGGSNSGGLFGFGQTSGTNNTTRLVQYQKTPTLGVTQTQVIQNAGTLQASGAGMSDRLSQYESSWNTIRSAASAAVVAVTDLANFCTTATTNAADTNTSFANIASAQASAAQDAIRTEIAPVLAKADDAAKIIADARAMMQKIQNEQNSNAEGAAAAYAADLQTLQYMPPTSSDVANAMQDAQAFGTAVAIPEGSLTVSGGSVVDRMALIANNAVALKSVCIPHANTGSGGSGD